MTVLLLLAALASPLTAQDEGVVVGSRAPTVVVNDLEGQPVDLGAWIGRRPVFLEFWATWCGSCDRLLPRVREAHRVYGGDVEFIGINVTIDDPPEAVRRYLAEHAPPFRTLYDTEGASVRAFDVSATSHVFVIGRDGTVVYSGSGGTQQFDEALRRVTGR